jgi:hypothetical protein
MVALGEEKNNGSLVSGHDDSDLMSFSVSGHLQILILI